MKFRKCQECGQKMSVKKSSKGGGKFWGCHGYPDCSSIIPYYGDGARAGFDVDIREIKNGYVVLCNYKYSENNDDEMSETYCSDVESLRSTLNGLLNSNIETLINKIESTTNFEDEIDQEKSKKRVERMNKGETDIKKLIKRISETKAKVAESENNED